MRFEIEINGVKPIGLNNYHKIRVKGRYPTKYKSESAVKFDSQINSALNAFKSTINKINSNYDEHKHYLLVDYLFYIPVFTKKKDRISKTSGDSDNFIKTIQDILFKRLNADDSSVISVSSTKIHSDNYSIKIILTIRDLKHIR